jgi:PDZ domain-containing secreted protein
MKRMILGIAVVAMMAALTVAAPAWSRTPTTTASMQVMEPMKVAGNSVTLEPGTYEFRVKANDPHVEILKDDKVVADVQGQWVQLDSKAPLTEVLSDKNTIQEIDIKGDNQALRFTNG